jgi:peptide/nickel transport system substrate-binding protein
LRVPTESPDAGRVAAVACRARVEPARRVVRTAAAAALVAALLAALAPGLARAEPQHGIAMQGRPALPAGFDHLPYVDPAAPKGGRLVFGLVGTFDSLNPFIVRGLAVQQMRGYVIESLLARGLDEPFSLYGLLAESLETDDARSFVTFHIHPRARFADGAPVTPEDVLFSYALLRDRGRPNYRMYYAKVARATVTGPRTVRFDFADAADRELPLILGLMPVLPKHAVDPERFEETSLAPPLGSGPYRVTAVRPGSSVTLTRNPDYWGRDLPVTRGLYNFDEVRIDYYRESNGAFEAFKRGLFDVRIETDPLRWHEGYQFPAAKRGEVVREEVRTGLPSPTEYLVFNTRRAIFADIRVRRALTLLFDFEWINRNYFFGLYSRAGGFFANSELSAYGVPASAGERRLLAPFPAATAAEVMDGSYRLPQSDGSGRDRDTLRTALALLAEAGYDLTGTTLRQRATGTPFAFELLVTTREQERIALAVQRDLRRAGIAVSVRVVDAAQFDQRRLAYDFDMIQNRWDQSLSPGNEQGFYWSRAAADTPGTRNYMGAREPAIDAMIGAMLDARSRPDFVDAVRALDRVLISGHYAIPLYNVDKQWIARWNRVQRPRARALSGYLPETWWQAAGSPAAP